MQLLIYWYIYFAHFINFLLWKNDLTYPKNRWGLSSWAIKNEDILTALSTPINDSPIINNPDV